METAMQPTMFSSEFQLTGVSPPLQARSTFQTRWKAVVSADARQPAEETVERV
ncbi:hypothetical protein [Sphingomonas sp.]|uniref:hypothetical protein n=1 Tax=Sphingomonas sp. TaxID=28214 RepID=UPI0033425E69